MSGRKATPVAVAITSGERCPRAGEAHEALPLDQRPWPHDKGRGFCWDCRNKMNKAEREDAETGKLVKKVRR